MQSYGCEFCNDLINVQPAKYVAVVNNDNSPVATDDEVRKFLEKAKEEKRFLMFEGDNIHVVNKCPACGYVFSEKDYDSYN